MWYLNSVPQSIKLVNLGCLEFKQPFKAAVISMDKDWYAYQVMTELPRETHICNYQKLFWLCSIVVIPTRKTDIRDKTGFGLSWTGSSSANLCERIGGTSGNLGRLLGKCIIGLHSCITLNSWFPIIILLKIWWCLLSGLYCRIKSNCFVRAQDSHIIMLVTFVLYQSHVRLFNCSGVGWGGGLTWLLV